MRAGVCKGPRSVRGQLASLYNSYAADIISDFMSKVWCHYVCYNPLTFLVMILPIRVVWNLQVPRGQKIVIIALFASGFVCVAFATLRLVQIGRQSSDTNSPNPTWLALWTLIETSVAICIGCGPAFVILYRATRSTNASRDTNGYYRHTHSQSDGAKLRPDVLRMNTISVGTSRTRGSTKDPFWNDDRSSQEALATNDKGIMVTTTLHQDHEPGNTCRNSLAA